MCAQWRAGRAPEKSPVDSGVPRRDGETSTNEWRTLSGRARARLLREPEFRLYDELPRGRELEVTSADGTRIHVEEFGPEHGYPIVLSHGICCGIRFWGNQIDALRSEYRVIAFDHRGHARSGRPAPGGWTTERLADDLAAVLRATLRPGQRAMLVGHSMGGITIQAWADRYPEEVARTADSVALINTTAGDLAGELTETASGGRVPAKLAPLLNIAGRFAMRVFGGVPIPSRIPLRTRLIAPLTVGMGTSRSGRILIQELILGTSAKTRGEFIRVLLQLREGHFDARCLTAPTLIIGSTDDRLLGFEPSRRLARSLPNTIDLLEVPGGHCAPVEQAETVTAELRALANSARAGITA